LIKDGALETKRLVLRPFEPGDATELVVMFSDAAVAKYVDDGEPLSLENADLWISRSRENVHRYGYGTGAVVDRASGLLVGWAGFARPADGPEQIIYGLAAPYWRRGLGREVLGALVNFANEQRFPSVAATVHRDNSRSAAMLLQYGFHLIERNHGGDPNSILYRRNLAEPIELGAAGTRETDDH
jgi:[ribosomal protein S5]-alanine N-acetyltransferase